MSDHHLLDHIFTGCDETDDGYISFSQFATALSVIFRGDREEITRFWFKMYDKDHDDYISKDEFEELLHDVSAGSKEGFNVAAGLAFHSPPEAAEAFFKGKEVECLNFQARSAPLLDTGAALDGHHQASRCSEESIQPRPYHPCIHSAFSPASADNFTWSLAGVQRAVHSREHPADILRAPQQRCRPSAAGVPGAARGGEGSESYEGRAALMAAGAACLIFPVVCSLAAAEVLKAAVQANAREHLLPRLSWLTGVAPRYCRLQVMALLGAEFELEPGYVLIHEDQATARYFFFVMEGTVELSRSGIILAAQSEGTFLVSTGSAELYC